MRVLHSQSKYVRLFVAITMVGLIGGTAGVYAYSQLDFGQKASEWHEQHCTQRLADQRKANDKSALCHSLQESHKNKEDIADIHSRLDGVASSGTFYRIIDKDIDINSINLDNGAGPFISRAIVPKNGVIDTLTVTKHIPGGALAGSVTFTLYVNEVEQELKTTVDSENPTNLTVIDGIEVQSGDIVAIKNDGNLTGGVLRYHVALYIRSE